jgi:hypothetical protein
MTTPQIRKILSDIAALEAELERPKAGRVLFRTISETAKKRSSVPRDADIIVQTYYEKRREDG